MERYSSYKDSNVSWIGMIPEHWEIRRFKSFFSVANGNGFKIEYQGLSSGDYPFLKVSDLNGKSNCISIAKNFVTEQMVKKESYNIIPVGSILFSKIGEALKKNHRKINIVPCCIDNNCSAIVRRMGITEDININYAYYIMKCVDMTWFDNGGTIPSVNIKKFISSSFTLPPLAEQEKIVSYLESKTSKIDAYVADKEKEIQLLQELKQKTIAEAVTKGLNPNVKMKDSGISWIGMIPEHWEMRKLSQVSYEHFISNKTIHHQNLLSLSYGRIIRKDINKTEGLLPASFDTYQIVEDGNIVLRLTDLQNDQKSLRVGLAKEEGIVTSAYVCLGVYNSMIPAYLYNVLHSYDIKKLFYSMGGGIRQGLNWQGLKKIDVPLPPLDEQRAIVSYIEEKCQKIDTLITELQAEIDYLKEYKQRLIADVVTGQVNVQNEI